MRSPYSQFPGTVTEYKNLHKWVNDNFGRPRVCEDCGTTEAKRYDWAVIDGKYTKDRNHWKRLCRSCHQKLDASLFVGKRFAGKSHTPSSRARTSITMRRYWQEHPEKYLETRRKSAETIKKRKEAKRGVI